MLPGTATWTNSRRTSQSGMQPERIVLRRLGMAQVLVNRFPADSVVVGQDDFLQRAGAVRPDRHLLSLPNKQ